MNEQNPNNPGIPRSPLGESPLPPRIPGTPSHAGAAQSLGADLAEQAPITSVFGMVEALLRQPRRVMFQLKQARPGGLIYSLMAITIVCAAIYGVVVGSFSMAEQLWSAPVKIVAGLLISGLICLPSLYIFSCLSGAQGRLIEVFGLVFGLLALMTILLLGFAPVALVFSLSTYSIVMMGSLHLAFWFVATVFGLRFLYGAFRHLNAKSDGGFQVWVVIFVLVALQMTTALRPILGKSSTFLPGAKEKKFFVQHWADCFKSEPETWPNGRNEPPK